MSVDQVLSKVQQSALEYIAKAIGAGDYSQFSNQENSGPKPAPRRALIVMAHSIAAQYEAHFREYQPLPATLQDVVQIHKMLREYGYRGSDIRILIDLVGPDVAPTRDNIIKGLNWLVSNTRAQDRRYIHFSGHGTCIPAKERAEGAKETIEIPSTETPTKSGDHELDIYSNETTQYSRVESLNVEGNRIKYYNEAIITSYQSVPLPLLLEGKTDKVEYNMVRDSILNEYFARLPEGSKLTCTFDCCHSGRLINNNFKLAGAGFRGRCFRFNEEGQTQEPLSNFSLSRMDDLVDRLKNQSIKNGFILDLKSTIKKVLTPNDSNISVSEGVRPPLNDWIMPQATLEDFPNSRGQTSQVTVKPVQPAQGAPSPTILSTMRNWLSPPLITMQEVLPADEINRDKIVADVLTWSSCHQRQKAREHSDEEGGLFTRSFAKVVKRKEGVTMSVRQVYEALNHDIKEQALNWKALDNHKKKPFLQYAQVWTSLGNGTEAEA
ncbi:hypothetical protein FRC07_013184, partial [Ceratobasidium sp. 392]